MNIKLDEPNEVEVVKVVARGEWGGLSPYMSSDKLTLPVSDVIFTWTDTANCSDPADCKLSVKKAFTRDRTEKKLPDIANNFLIGGDGMVYEGRGAEFKPQKNKEYSDLEGKSLDIAFVGDYEHRDPNYDLADVAQKFIYQLVKEKRLVENYWSHWKGKRMGTRYFTQTLNPFREIVVETTPNTEEEDEKLLAKDFKNHMLYQDRAKREGFKEEEMPG